MRGLRILLTLIAVATIVVAGWSLITTVRSFYRLDFPVRWLSDGLVVDQVAPGTSAAAAGLKPGDAIVAVDGIAVARLEDPAFLLAAGDERVLEIRSASGEGRELAFRPPPPAIDALYLTRTSVGLLGLLCALYVVWRTDRREAAVLLLIACASLILGAVPHRTAASREVLRVPHRMAGAALPFLIARFFIIFPERRASLRLLAVLTVVFVAGAAVTAVVPNAEGWWPVLASVLRALFTLALVGGIALHVARWWKALGDARTRRQIEWAALGLFVGLVPWTAVMWLPSRLGLGVEPFSWMMVLPMAALPLALAAALTEYQLWDLEPIARDALSATLVLVIGGLAFAVTNHLLQIYAGGLESLRNLFAFVMGVTLVVLLQPIRSRVGHFLERWLYHGHRPPQWLLTHASREIAQVTDPRELLGRLAMTLHDGLDFDVVATYLRVGGGSFVRVSSTGGVVPERLPEKVLASPFPAAEEIALEDAGYTVRLPLHRVDAVHGLLYLGLRRGLFPLGSEAAEVIGAFTAQAAVALESARYLDDLRQQAEEYRILHANTQRIIESSAAAILVCDASGRILSANSVAAGIFDVAPRDLVSVPLESLVELPDTWRDLLPLQAANAEGRTRNQPSRRVIMAVSMLELDSGSFNGRVVVLQDVTELRELQDRIRDQDRLAALGRLASGLAHEINTPLTGIASFAQMLGDMTPADDPRSSLVSKLVDQSFRVSRIVSNLRQAIRGGGEERSVVDLTMVARHAATEAARSLGAADRLVFEEGPPVTVAGAAGPVELAVSNMVRNAIEASPAGEAVRVAVRERDGWAEVSVDDRGPGVDQADIERVFEPFFTTKTERGGTGLGLAITRDMIASLGGEVSLENLAGGGARASVRLRLWKESEASS
ncbi:MAG: ATP-binding protein [Thermoanaerobaculales bacterium]|nr:ATP-binding protein [Thermoanaerobaculales bacterium]